MQADLLHTLVQTLSERLKQTLPGSDAQYLMAPQYRYKGATPHNCIHAAVTLLLFSKNGDICFPLIKRTADNGPHSRQVSFPGGRLDKSDPSLDFAAIRELNEETGCIIGPNKIIGKLTELYIPVSNTLVTPFVCYSDKVPIWKPDPKEVERILEVPVSLLLDHSIIKSEKLNLMKQDTLVPYFEIDGEKVWGATAMILSEFIEIVKC